MSETNTTTPLKITRTLYVGLGGTGVKAILRTKQCFIDAYGEVPPMVGFLAIDTDTAIHQQVLLNLHLLPFQASLHIYTSGQSLQVEQS